MLTSPHNRTNILLLKLTATKRYFRTRFIYIDCVNDLRSFIRINCEKAYDYGKERNLKEYGQEQPIDFFDNYDKIDIPIYFVMGLSDTLIQPVSVIAHYFALEQHHPELAHLKAIPKIGHIDFTVGMNEILSRYILEVLQCKKDGPIE
jgi:hypothetical protein